MCCARQHLQFSSFAHFFNTCNTKRDSGENGIFFFNLSQQEFTVTNAASAVALARAKNVVGHILHGMFRSVRSTGFLSHK